jgi:hypothetical protein
MMNVEIVIITLSTVVITYCTVTTPEYNFIFHSSGYFWGHKNIIYTIADKIITNFSEKIFNSNNNISNFQHY